MTRRKVVKLCSKHWQPPRVLRNFLALHSLRWRKIDYMHPARYEVYRLVVLRHPIDGTRKFRTTSIIRFLSSADPMLIIRAIETSGNL